MRHFSDWQINRRAPTVFTQLCHTAISPGLPDIYQLSTSGEFLSLADHGPEFSMRKGKGKGKGKGNGRSRFELCIAADQFAFGQPLLGLIFRSPFPKHSLSHLSSAPYRYSKPSTMYSITLQPDAASLKTAIVFLTAVIRSAIWVIRRFVNPLRKVPGP